MSANLMLLFYINDYYWWWCGWWRWQRWWWLTVCVWVRRQPVETSSLLPCESQELNLGYQALHLVLFLKINQLIIFKFNLFFKNVFLLYKQIPSALPPNPPSVLWALQACWNVPSTCSFEDSNTSTRNLLFLFLLLSIWSKRHTSLLGENLPRRGRGSSCAVQDRSLISEAWQEHTFPENRHHMDYTLGNQFAHTSPQCLFGQWKFSCLYIFHRESAQSNLLALITWHREQNDSSVIQNVT